MPSMYDVLIEAADADNLDDAASKAGEVAGRVNAMDDHVRQLIKIADDYKDNFDSKTIEDLREHCDNIKIELENMQKELY